MSAKNPGHVDRSIAMGRRPFLTCTIAPATFSEIDRLCLTLDMSRGKLIDLAITILTAQSARDAPESKEAPESSPEVKTAA